MTTVGRSSRSGGPARVHPNPGTRDKAGPAGLRHHRRRGERAIPFQIGPYPPSVPAAQGVKGREPLAGPGVPDEGDDARAAEIAGSTGDDGVVASPRQAEVLGGGEPGALDQVGDRARCRIESRRIDRARRGDRIVQDSGTGKGRFGGVGAGGAVSGDVADVGEAERSGESPAGRAADDGWAKGVGATSGAVSPIAVRSAPIATALRLRPMVTAPPPGAGVAAACSACFACAWSPESSSSKGVAGFLPGPLRLSRAAGRAPGWGLGESARHAGSVPVGFRTSFRVWSSTRSKTPAFRVVHRQVGRDRRAVGGRL